MNKQEVIDKQALIDELMKIPGVGSNGDALKMIKRFPSYEPQKVKVPAFVAPFIEKLKITNSRYGVELEKAYNNEEDEELVNWLGFNENVLTLFRALEKGYEVEEEPKWVVKIEDNGSAYFVDFFDELQPHLVCGLSGEVMRFDSEDKANAIVTLIECGTVEKVQV